MVQSKINSLIFVAYVIMIASILMYKRLTAQDCIKQRPSSDPVTSCAPHTSGLIRGGVELTPALTLQISTILLTFCSDTHVQVKTRSQSGHSHISTYSTLDLDTDLRRTHSSTLCFNHFSVTHSRDIYFLRCIRQVSLSVISIF